MKKSDELFKILDIEKTSDKEKIKKAYKNKAKKCHPDSGGNENDFKELNFAFSILISEEKKSNYDSGTNYRDEESEMLSAISTLFQDAIENCPGKILEYVKNAILERLHDLDRKINSNEKKKIKYEKLKGKVYNSKNGLDMFNSLIEKNIEQHSIVIESLKKNKKLMQEVGKEIKNYSEKCVPQESPYSVNPGDFLFRTSSSYMKDFMSGFKV